jgi:hypothetical protein
MKKLLTTAVVAAFLAMPIAASANAKPVDAIANQTNPVLIAEKMAQVAMSGSFVEVAPNHPTVGTAKLVEREGKMFLEFSADFQTVEGPAVRVVLHKSGDVPVKIEGTEYVKLGDLKSISGAQSYEIELPPGEDINDYKSAVVWCEQFDVTFAAAAFKAR